MKLINHHNGNHTYISATDSTVIKGTIELTQKEYSDSIAFLRKQYSTAKRKGYTYERDSLAHVFMYADIYATKTHAVCLGVCATEILLGYLNGGSIPKRYKKQNYQIIITA